MQEKWNDFVYDLSEAKKKGDNEDTYHEKIEKQLQFLGWQPYKGDICHKPNIPIGNSNYIQPDILVKKEGEDQFVIEVKRPVHSQSERERVQLESYMRQLKLDIGIYIGEHIEVFYDMPKYKDAVSILRIPLEFDNKLGMTFAEKFSKENFNKDSIVAFCEERIKEMQRQSDLKKIKENLITDAQMHITESLKTYLLEKYEDTFSEEDIRGMLSTLIFTAKDKEQKPIVVQTKVTPQPSYKEDVKTKTKAKYDYTKYSLNGGPWLGKGRFVHSLVSTYMKQHPNTTFQELEQMFPPELQGSFGVVKTMEYVSKNNDRRRYFDKTDEILRTGDGVFFAVSTQWGIGNISNIVRRAKDLGFTVKKDS